MAFNVTEVKGYQVQLVDDNYQVVAVNAISASDIALDSTIEVIFSEDVASNSVLSFALTLFRTLPDGGSQVPVDVSLSQPETNKIVITPVDNFIPQATYALFIPKSKHGIRDSEGNPLTQGFNCDFSAGGNTDLISDPGGTADDVDDTVEDTTPTSEDVVVDEVVTADELFLVGSSPADESILQYGFGMLNAKFDGKLPDGITVDIVTRHPLGFIAGSQSLWSDNSTKDTPLVSLDQTELSVKSEILQSEIEDASLIVDVTSDSITSADQIPVVGTSTDSDGNDTYVLDYDINKVYDIEFKIPGNTENPMMSFMGLLYPFYATLEEVKVDIGPFVNQYDDFTLTLSIFRHSITARQIWEEKNSMPAITPIRLGEYVMARTKRDILATYFTDPTQAGSGAFALGDLRMSGRSYLEYLKEIVSTLDLKIVALENALKRGDTSTSPYTDFGHQSLPTSSVSVAAGEADGRDWTSKNMGRGFSSKVNKNG